MTDLVSMRFSPPEKWWDGKDGKGNYYVQGITKVCNAVSKNRNHKLNMIEIGVWRGESTSLFALSGFFESIDTIDPWDNEYHDQLKNEFDINTRHWDYIKHHTEYSYNCADKFHDKSYDLVYIDGAHDYKSAKQDIELFLPKVRKGCWIGGHDYMVSGFGVTKAVNELLGKPYHIFRDSSWLFQIK